MALYASDSFSTRTIYPCSLANSSTFFYKSSFSDMQPPTLSLCHVYNSIFCTFIIAIFQNGVKPLNIFYLKIPLHLPALILFGNGLPLVVELLAPG